MLKISLFFLRNLQTSQANNSRILSIMNAKFSVYCFYMNTNIYGDFQTCISVPLILVFQIKHFRKSIMKAFVEIRFWYDQGFFQFFFSPLYPIGLVV